jgi:hypothetical protein
MREKESSYNKGVEKIIDINEFYFMREISMMCFLPLILLEKVDHD